MGARLGEQSQNERKKLNEIAAREGKKRYHALPEQLGLS